MSLLRSVKRWLERAAWAAPSPEVIERTRTLIADYFDAVSAAVALLEAHFGPSSPAELLRGVRAGRIPTNGTLAGAHYAFHGAGCRVSLARGQSPFRGVASGDFVVDFELIPFGRFDAERLAEFDASKHGAPNALAALSDDGALERSLAWLAREKTLTDHGGGFYSLRR
ncbi:MAG: hypothetical protein U0235_33105 [Polyangiaceae bacterium]